MNISTKSFSVGYPDGFISLSAPGGGLVSVFSIVQDATGYLWLGTDEGLMRYDGYDYRIYCHDVDDSGSLPNDIVNALCFDSDSELLYVGTDEGMVIYDPDTDAFSGVPDSDGLHVKAICMTPLGLLVGTTTGLFRLSGQGDSASATSTGNFASATSDGNSASVTSAGNSASAPSLERLSGDDLPSEHIASIACDANGDVWVGSYGHLYRVLPTGHFEIYPVVTSGSNILVLCIAPGNQTPATIPGNQAPATTPGSQAPATRPDSQAPATSPGSQAPATSPSSQAPAARSGSQASVARPGSQAPATSPTQPRTLWVGTEAGLIQYDTATRTAVTILENVPVKTFLSDGDRLWCGTDNGLYIKTPDAIAVYRHQVGNPESLPDNVIWSIFLDRDGNAWLGTDHGMSVVHSDSGYRYTNVSEMTGSPEGLDIGVMEVGNDGNLWLAGRNGLIRYNLDSGKGRWYKADAGPLHERLSHNKVRDIYSDPDGLWIASDGGLDYLSYSDGRIRHFNLTEPTGRYSSNWMYSIGEDDYGRLWAGTYDGGLFAIDRTRLLTASSGQSRSATSSSHRQGQSNALPTGQSSSLPTGQSKTLPTERTTISVQCDHHFSRTSTQPLSSNVTRVFATTPDYLFAAGSTLDIIDLQTFQVTHIPVPDGESIYSLLADGDTLWIGTDRSLRTLSITSRTHFSKRTSSPPGNENSQADGTPSGNEKASPSGNGQGSAADQPEMTKIADMEGGVSTIRRDGNRLWLISGERLLSLDTGTRRISLVPSLNPILNVIPCGDHLCLGTIDGIVRCPSTIPTSQTSPNPVRITDILYKDQPIRAGREYFSRQILPSNIDRTDRIILPHRMNSFTITFSAFNYSTSSSRFVYRLQGSDPTWMRTPEGTNRAVFIGLPSGEYTFEVASEEPGQTGAGTSPVTSLRIKIRPVWYATTGAFILYSLIFIALCALAFYYLKMRHDLQMEHAERERAIRMADMKTEFLANVSHEFKSPLSIILSFLGRMVASESDALKTRELRTVCQNAEKIHILLNQMVEFNENRSTSLFIPTPVSLQNLVRSVYDRYAEAFARKHIVSRFVSDDIGYIFMVDSVRMESVIQNLLSNALKFTPEGGTVLVSVTIGEENSDMIHADIKVEDTGCGIAPEELPLIFNRYYRAPSNQKDNPDGTGIGLALVKEIVEQHKGTISVTSQVGKGTVFTVRLTTMKADSFILKGAGKEEFSLHNLSNVWQHNRKPIILLVEDNPDIRDFITASLGKDYVFLLAEEGQTGLDILEKEKVDLVITDLVMPGGMDGLAMSKAIRNSLKTTFLPIIILTGKNDMETQVKSYEYADAFIAKPFNLNFLNNRIIQLLIKHEQHLAKIRQQQMLEPVVEDAGPSFDEKILQEVAEIVSRHLEDPSFSASALCEESKFSSKQIYRKIKQLTGMSIVEFIRDTRVRKAASYLAQGKFSVNEVMYKVGFTTPSYFARCFKEKYGVNPSEYHSQKPSD